MKIVDGFMFYNELKLLKYRLALLYPVIDHFVLVEATHTHKGNPKRLYFQENKDEFKEYMDKIVHVIVEDMPYHQDNINYKKGDAWKNEEHQRNGIARSIDKLDLASEDLILITDVDEIPDPIMISQLRASGISYPMMSLKQDIYYYNLHTQQSTPWFLGKLIVYWFYLRNKWTLSEIRKLQNIPFLPSGGWHLSYFGDASLIQNKLQQFAHHEYSGENYTNQKTIQARIDSSSDLFGRPTDVFTRIELKDNGYLPPRYEEFLSDFL